MFKGFQTQNTETSPKKPPEVPANGDAAVATPRLAEAVTGATALAVSAVLDFLYSGSWTAGLPSSNLYIIYKEYEYRLYVFKRASGEGLQGAHSKCHQLFAKLF